MSEIGDYTRKILTCTYAELVDEKKIWTTQQAKATGQDIVEAEMKKRTGEPYIILKDFVDADGILRKKGKAILENQLTILMRPSLLANGYIETV